MSTRAQIKIKDYDVTIYKHSDGYPQGVIPSLRAYLGKFVKNRGNDKEYAIARILMNFALLEKEYREKMPSPFNEESFTGWGLCTDLHGDIEYLYIVDLECRKIEIVDTVLDESSIVFF